ncbi:MAG: hypothetical protein K6F52_07855 [Clostridia bacterium]|nr:hypothetical protein [Clostridia bacterium]
MEKDLFLGIDTSNYKTSVAIVDGCGRIICDIRKLLKVKEGEKGLRQSYALFQHIENLPGMISEAFRAVPQGSGTFKAVAFSDRPRPVEGSYMPVFRAGELSAVSAASALGIPVFGFSHQEGHLEAIKAFSDFKECDEYLAYHLSGGTCELLKVSGGKIEILGGSKDISFGQLLDRLGVFLGLQFPAGEELDRMACSAAEKLSRLKNDRGLEAGKESELLLKKIKIENLKFNLSGTETKLLRIAGTLKNNEKTQGKSNYELNALIKETFDVIADCLIRLTSEAVRATGIPKVMFAGGVSQSRYISDRLKEHFDSDSFGKAGGSIAESTESKGISEEKSRIPQITFGRQELSTDNAVGTALLALQKYTKGR